MRTETSTTFGEDVSVSTAIIEAVADLSDVEPADLDLVLYEYVDPDALDVIFEQSAHRNDRMELEFVIDDEFEVTVRDEGTVAVQLANRSTAIPSDTRGFSD